MGQRGDGSRLHHHTQNGMQLKTYKLFVSGIFHVIFLELDRPWVTETVGNETSDKGGGY